MGGLLILLALVLATLLWADLRSGLVWATLVLTVGYGLLGFADDWLKVTKRNTKRRLRPDEALGAGGDRPGLRGLDHLADAAGALAAGWRCRCSRTC